MKQLSGLESVFSHLSGLVLLLNNENGRDHTVVSVDERILGELHFFFLFPKDNVLENVMFSKVDGLERLNQALIHMDDTLTVNPVFAMQFMSCVDIMWAPSDPCLEVTALNF